MARLVRFLKRRAQPLTFAALPSFLFTALLWWRLGR
jgi:hypothetical protein